MFCTLTYLFGHSIYFARLCHVNPQCKHKCAFLQMKEAPNHKVQEKKPLLKFKNTNKNMCLKRIWKTCFRHRPLLDILIDRLMEPFAGACWWHSVSIACTPTSPIPQFATSSKSKCQRFKSKSMSAHSSTSSSSLPSSPELQKLSSGTRFGRAERLCSGWIIIFVSSPDENHFAKLAACP